MDFWFFVAATAFVGVCATGWWAFQAYHDGQFARGWRRMRVLSLGGATTLERDLNYVCRLCLHSMDAGEKVRTLSCDHVFHRGGISKCENGIDKWLRTAPRMICPDCHQTPHSVLPWKAPPPLLLMEHLPPPPQSSSESYGNKIAPPHSSSGLESTTLPHASSGSYDVVIEVRPPQSSSGSENTSPPEPSDKPLLPRSKSA